MDNIPETNHGLISTLLGFLNGAYYGTKIRAPHALVMTFLFREGTLQEKLLAIVKLTFEVCPIPL